MASAAMKVIGSWGDVFQSWLTSSRLVRPQGGTACLVGREAAARMLLLEQTQVRVDFFGELAFSSARADELTQPAAEATH